MSRGGYHFGHFAGGLTYTDLIRPIHATIALHPHTIFN